MTKKGDFKDRTGEVHINSRGIKMEIVESNGTFDMVVKFEDGSLINTRYSNIKRGCVKNPYERTIYGVGYFGVGEYIGKHIPKVYDAWRGMVRRCYEEKSLLKDPNYIGCSVDERWHNFQVFAKWHDDNYNLLVKDGWNLDKDIVFRGNKIYSPETCFYVPQQINKLFIKSDFTRGKCLIGVCKTGNCYTTYLNRNGVQDYLGVSKTEIEAHNVYKTAKENYIKEVAHIWKDKIDIRVFEAMMAYEVEIRD